MVSPVVVSRGRPYLDQVKRAAAEYGVPWWLLAAVVAVESEFIPRAYRAEPQAGRDSFGNTVASYGLTQVLPDSAKSVGIRLSSAEQLYDVDTNLRAGAAYLSRLRGKGDGTWNAVISLYNGGSGIPVKAVTRFCLEWKPTAPVDRAKRSLDRDCRTIYTAKIGEYLNQPYVDRVNGYATAFRALDSTTAAVNDAVDAVHESPGRAIALLVAIGLGLALFKGAGRA